MSDRIRVLDLEVQAHIGVPEAERVHPQRLLISLDLLVPDFAAAAAADDVALTVNYFDVTQRVKKLVVQRQRKLLETLAEEIAQDLLARFDIDELTVEIKKFILPDTRYVSVKIARQHKTKPPT